MLWKMGRKSGKTGSKRVCGSALLLVLCGLCSLLSCLPASAIELTGGRAKLNITSFARGANVYQYDDVRVSNGSITGSLYHVVDQIYSATTNIGVNTSNACGAGSLLYFTGNVSNANTAWSTPAPTGTQYFPVLWSEIDGDNGNFSFAALYYVGGDNYTAIPIWNNVWLGGFLRHSTTATLTISAPTCLETRQTLTASDLSEIKTQLSNIAWNTNVTQNEVRNQLNTLIEGVNTADTRLNTIISALSELKTSQQATNDKLDREYNQDQQDRSDAQDAVDNSQTSADDSQASLQNSSQSLLDAMGATVNLIRDTPATNCKIPIDTGNLDLGEVDLCSVPNDVKQLINRVFGLVMIVGGLLLSLNIFHSAMALFAQATGYSYNPPTVTGGKR